MPDNRFEQVNHYSRFKDVNHVAGFDVKHLADAQDIRRGVVFNLRRETVNNAFHRFQPVFGLVVAEDFDQSANAPFRRFEDAERSIGLLIGQSAPFVAISSALAQGNGIAGITEATNMVTSYFDPGTKLVYAVGAVVGLIGGIKVYNKFSSGDPDTSKTAASWFGACIFLIVAATILRSFFL